MGKVIKSEFMFYNCFQIINRPLKFKYK